MGITDKFTQYREWKKGVKHCTFNPEGPGVVRMHLVPPKFSLFRRPAHIVILNGYYLLPVGPSWAVMLSAFMDEVNKFDGKEISDTDSDSIVKKTVDRTVKAYPYTDRTEIEDDLYGMLDVLFTVAKGGTPSVEIEKMSLRSYSDNMTAPHRMDLMVSAMTDSQGVWKCNQKCTFCYAAGQALSNGRELTTDEWKKAIDKLKAAGVPMLTFTGGEPTQREDLAELIDYSKWFVTRVNTNGVLLDPELVEKLKKASLDSIQVTLYSHSSEIHNCLVGSVHFEDTVKGIKNAVSAGLDISINTPLCRKNSDYIKTLKFVYSLGVRFVTVSGLICTGAARGKFGENDLSEKELCSILADAKVFCDENGMEINFTSPGLVSKEALEEIGLNVPMCGAALSNMAISPDGTVIPCQSWLSSGAGLGNILTDSFSGIWKKEECVKLRGMNDEEALLCPFRSSKAEVSGNG